MFILIPSPLSGLNKQTLIEGESIEIADSASTPLSLYQSVLNDKVAIILA